MIVNYQKINKNYFVKAKNTFDVKTQKNREPNVK
jgi:hypothetical protein